MDSGTLIFPCYEMDSVSLFVDEETDLETLGRSPVLNNNASVAHISASLYNILSFELYTSIKIKWLLKSQYIMHIMRNFYVN